MDPIHFKDENKGPHGLVMSVWAMEDKIWSLCWVDDVVLMLINFSFQTNKKKKVILSQFYFPLHLSFQCFGTFIKLMGHCSRILDSEQISSKSEIMIFLAGRKVNFEPCRVSSALSICFKFSIISIMSTWRKNDNYFWCEITQRNRVKINKTMQLCADKKKMCQGKFLPCDASPQTTLSISCKRSPASTILKPYLPFFFFFILPCNSEIGYKI